MFFAEVIDCHCGRDFWNFIYLLEDESRFAVVLERNNPFIYKCLQFSPYMCGCHV